MSARNYTIRRLKSASGADIKNASGIYIRVKIHKETRQVSKVKPELWTEAANTAYAQRYPNDIDVKNLLEIGQVSLEEVGEIIGRSRGNDYSSSLHHFDSSITVHIIKTRRAGHNWYVKWYFVEPNSVFISVHH
mgnify:CR=1 FL=1